MALGQGVSVHKWQGSIPTQTFLAPESLVTAFNLQATLLVKHLLDTKGLNCPISLHSKENREIKGVLAVIRWGCPSFSTMVRGCIDSGCLCPAL